jgi:hypothetical protein
VFGGKRGREGVVSHVLSLKGEKTPERKEGKEGKNSRLWLWAD